MQRSYELEWYSWCYRVPWQYGGGCCCRASLGGPAQAHKMEVSLGTGNWTNPSESFCVLWSLDECCSWRNLHFSWLLMTPLLTNDIGDMNLCLPYLEPKARIEVGPFHLPKWDDAAIYVSTRIKLLETEGAGLLTECHCRRTDASGLLGDRARWRACQGSVLVVLHPGHITQYSDQNSKYCYHY